MKKAKKRVPSLWDDAPLLGSKAALKKTKKRKPSQWVELKNVQKWENVSIIMELKKIAVEYATYPGKKWTSEEIVEYMHDCMARRRKRLPIASLDEDKLPRGHKKLRY